MSDVSVLDMLDVLKNNIEKGVYTEEEQKELFRILKNFMMKGNIFDPKYYLTGWFVHNYGEVAQREGNLKEQKLNT